MKKTALILSLAMAGTLTLSSCGDAESSRSANSSIVQQNESVEVYSKAGEADFDAEANDNDGITQVNYEQSEAKAINTQMLIYSCDMSIDVLEFDNAVDQIHELIKEYNGFIESENYSDGGNTSQWLYSETNKWKSLNATIRIPSAKYDAFCKATEEIGDMRRKNSSVQNLTTEYSDLKTTHGIYEAKEKRYLDILADIKNESDAIAVENELTSIQVEIAKIKTRMNNIENDVAYSYINLKLNEVREYSEKPVVVETDTFGQRLKNTLSKTGNGFLNFLEVILFIIIRVLPYVLFVGLIIFIFVKVINLIFKISDKKAKKRQQQTPVTVQDHQVNTTVKAPANPPSSAPTSSESGSDKTDK